MKKGLFILLFLMLLAPSVQAGGHAYAVIDAQTGRLLAGSNEEVRLPIASLTKMWTALIVLENSHLQDEVTISKEAVASEGSSIYLQAGQTYTVETLLYGLMLRSGNDAAYALAEHVGGSIEGFVHLMNERARFASLEETTFRNPSGLHDEAHLSSAYDTARMLQIAMQNDQFKKIASTIVYNGEQNWQNKHKLLAQKDGAIAGKTGYTKIAGRTLATYFKKDNKEFIVVTLNESNDWRVHRSLADHIDANYSIKTVVKKGTYEIADETIILTKPIKLLTARNERKELQHIVYLPKNKKQKDAVWSVYYNGQRIHTTAVSRQ